MRPSWPISLRVRATTVVTVFWWLLVYAVITARMLLDPIPGLLGYAERRAAIILGTMVVCLGAVRFVERRISRPWQSVLFAASFTVAGSVVYSLVNEVVMSSMMKPGEKWNSTQSIALTALGMLFIFAAWCGMILSVTYGEQMRDQQIQLARSEALAADAQNRMLRYQINPHFLFNTLNALSSLILHKDNERAEQMVQSLSAFLRNSLEKDPAQKVTLAEELDVQRQYLQIEQIRFGERLKFEASIPADLRDVLAPSLILQPLIENALKHGFSTGPQHMTLSVVAERDGPDIVMRVVDDGAGPQAPIRLGVGLQNVRRRLDTLYGDAGIMRYSAREPQGFEVVISFPMERR